MIQLRSESAECFAHQLLRSHFARSIRSPPGKPPQHRRELHLLERLQGHPATLKKTRFPWFSFPQVERRATGGFRLQQAQTL